MRRGHFRRDLAGSENIAQATRAFIVKGRKFDLLDMLVSDPVPVDRREGTSKVIGVEDEPVFVCGPPASQNAERARVLESALKIFDYDAQCGVHLRRVIYDTHR